MSTVAHQKTVSPKSEKGITKLTDRMKIPADFMVSSVTMNGASVSGKRLEIKNTCRSPK